MHRPRRGGALFSEVVVPTDDRRDYLAGVAKGCLQCAARSDRAVAYFDRQVGLFFASDACEKLVKEMNDFNWL